MQTRLDYVGQMKIIAKFKRKGDVSKMETSPFPSLKIHLSKWIELRAGPRTSVNYVERFLRKQIVLRHGCRALCSPTVEPHSALNFFDVSWQPMEYGTRKQYLTGLKSTDSLSVLTILSLTHYTRTYIHRMTIGIRM